jgi:diguanylate cyclase (GGDEF)-like protein
LILALNETMSAGELVATLLLEITIDLNNFTYLKDAVGISVADLLLREAAQRLQNSLSQTRAKKALLARWHGTAFIVLLPGVLDNSEVRSCCQQLLESLASSFRIQGHTVPVTAHGGIAVAPYDGNTYAQLIERTERALQAAKQQGGGTFLVYTPHLNPDTVDPREMEQAFSQALERQEFSLHYQPQVKIATGEIVGVEALLRWESAPSGGGSPATFIPLAEHLGLMEPLGLWVFQTACEQVMVWKEADLNSCRISVNLSPFQLMDPQLCQKFEQILATTGAQPQDFALEVTEKTVMENLNAAQSTLNQLRSRGFRVALDNFGTGSSSLTVLRTLPIDILKIAREFLQGLESGTQGIALYQAIVDLGKSLKLEIIAEGVETALQWNFVKLAGAQIVQGYVVTQPMESNLIRVWIRQQEHRFQLNTIAQGKRPDPLALTPMEAPPLHLSVITSLDLNADQVYESVDQAIQQGILEYSQMQTMMRQQAEREHLVMQISNKIRQSLDLDYILNTLVTEVRQLLDCDRLFLFQFDANWLGKVVMESVTDPSLSILGEWIDEPCFRNDYVKLYRQGRIRAIDDITQVGLAPCHLEILQKYQVKANLVLPVLYQDELWGLMIAHHCQAVRHWLPREITLLTEIAVQAAIAIHQGELYGELQQANQALENLATLDGLTKIANRRKFDQYLQQEWRRATRSHSPLSMILCDIDHFKKYNDTYGHQAGDACLQQVAKTLAQAVSRSVDLAARYGGEEFALILPDTSEEGALHLAQQVRSQIHSLGIAHRASTFEIVTLSMGVATLIPQPGQEPGLLIEAADQALYQAKETGRDRYCTQAQLKPNLTTSL